MDAPDIRSDNPGFFDIRYPAGYRIALPDNPGFFDIRSPPGYRIALPDIG
jgi:hypothetical protein